LVVTKTARELSYDWVDFERAAALVSEYRDTRHKPHNDYWFDDTAARIAVDFFPKYCRFTKGKWTGQPFVLAAWQALDIIIPAYGWKNPDGTRRYREVIIWVPRKNGKTELMSGVAHIHLSQDGEFVGEVYAIAKKGDQAKIVFDAAQRQVRFSPLLSAMVVNTAKSIYHASSMSRFMYLSGEPSGEHGKGPSCIIGDECHEWSSDRLYQFLAQGMGARAQPMTWLISTAGLPEGYGYELWESSKMIVDGVIDDPETLVVIYAADPKDDIYDIETWKKANPNFGISPTEKYALAEMRKAKRSVRMASDVKRYHLNIWAGEAERWLMISDWAENNTDPRIKNRWQNFEKDLLGQPCFGGLDLATTRDINALVWIFPPYGQRTKWAILPRFWMPRGSEKSLQDRVRLEKVRYDLWGASGAIALTDGNAADHDLIELAIHDDCEKFDVQALGFDAWEAHNISVRLSTAGVNMLKVIQGYITLSYPSKRFEAMVLERRFDHAGHPVLAWMAANTVIRTNPAGSIKPDKDKSRQKIDGIVASIMALALALNEQEEEETGTYVTSSNLVVL